ncbi:MAG TPA: pitrilysin family protein [Longimicrobium sp.]|nr:pitrilysin family protein [Longimicrobium sp.]
MPPDTVAVLPIPPIGPPARLRLPRPLRWTLDNGLRVIAIPRPGMPQVVMRLVLPAGSAADPPEYPGTASLVGHLLTEGTAALTADELHARLDLLGAAIHPHVSHDFAEVETVFLRETLAEGVRLLADVVTRPGFPESETERVRAESLDAILARDDEPSNVADDRTALEVFGADHPYGHPSFGTPRGVASVPREALAAFHAERYRPRGAFLVASGELDADELRALLAEAFAHWTGQAPPVRYPAGPPPVPRAGGTVLVEWEDAAQSEIRIAGIGLDRRTPEWFAGGIANYVLGGSTITGRLGANLREDKGWTYGVRSTFHAGQAIGGWVAETAVDVEVTADAVAEMVGEMRRMATEAVPEDELRRAKDALMLSLPRVFETPAGVASRLATIEAYGLPHDWWDRFPAAVEAVTADDVREMARRHFDPARLVRVVVGGGIEE